MRKRFWLCKRNRTFYVKDAQTQQRISLQTTDRAAAERLVHAREEAENQPMINLSIAKTYLAAADPRMTQRTWREIMDQFCSRGRDSTRKRRERAMCCRAFDLIRDQKIVETTADQLREIHARGGAFTKHAVRLMHNLALGLGWLPWPIIPPKLWPEIATKPKRAITWEEHE